MNFLMDDKAIIEAMRALKKEDGSVPCLAKNSVNNTRTLVVVVDMINGFLVSGALSDKRCDSITNGICIMLDSLSASEVAFICDSHSSTSEEFKSYPPHCLVDSYESEVVEALKKHSGTIVKKNSTNGFFALSHSLDLAAYDNFIVVGVCSDICVMQLALTLKGYFNEKDMQKNIIVLSDLLETFSTSGHSGDLFNLMSVKLMENAGIKIYKNITD